MIRSQASGAPVPWYSSRIEATFHLVEVILSPGCTEEDLLDCMAALEGIGAVDVDAEEGDPPRVFGLLPEAPEHVELDLASVREVWIRALGAIDVVAIPDERALPLGRGIETGAAFGTGLHPTTALMLSRIAGADISGTVLDVGTGTGILAIACLQRGAARVVVTDIDPTAVATALKNAARTGFASKVTAAPAVPDYAFDLVLANIRAAPLVELAPKLVRAVAPGGRLWLSGIRAAEVDRVVASFTGTGLSLEHRSYADGWLSVAFAWSAAVGPTCTGSIARFAP